MRTAIFFGFMVVADAIRGNGKLEHYDKDTTIFIGFFMIAIIIMDIIDFFRN
jgi:hypothetical protein